MLSTSHVALPFKFIALFRSKAIFIAALSMVLLAAVQPAFAKGSTQTDLLGTPGGTFGNSVAVLPNGNIVVADSMYDRVDSSPALDVGAVYLYNGRTLALISKMVGEIHSSQIGASITVLTNGNFVVSGGVSTGTSSFPSPATHFCSGVTGCTGTMTAANSFGDGVIVPLKNGDYAVVNSTWNNGAVSQAGAVTVCNGDIGCVGEASPSNSLVGSNDMDLLGGIVELSNGGFVICNYRWNHFRGAVTFCPPSHICTGVVSAENSLIGSRGGTTLYGGDSVGYVSSTTDNKGITTLANGNYVVGSYLFGQYYEGAVTWCSGSVGCHGVVSSDNSVIGDHHYDHLGSSFALPDGNYVAVASEWNGVGAARLCDGTIGCLGSFTSANSLTGSAQGSGVGQGGVVVLANGNYLVVSYFWGTTNNQGAVTFCNSRSPVVGPVTATNSLVGRPYHADRIGMRHVIPLANGNYVVNSEYWGEGAGASTFGDGNTGVVGEVSETNSLVGTSTTDALGVDGIALTNGNYVVSDPGWNGSKGAAKFCSGTVGCKGPISAENSIIGSMSGDRVGHLKALANGNYLVTSLWNQRRGSITLGDGINGTSLEVSPLNSLVGSVPSDEIADAKLIALSDGNYVVNTSTWTNAGMTNAGAVTFGSGTQPLTGPISAQNSLVGTHTNDQVGYDGYNTQAGGGVYPLTNGGYVVRSRYFDNGNITDGGAVSLGKAGVGISGPVSNANSVLGTYSVGARPSAFVYDYVNRQLVAPRADSAIVSIFQYDNAKAAFDFDGDGKSDESVFRPSNGTWYLNRSQAGFTGYQFGANDDLLTPSDFTGDGKTEVAVFRPSSGTWFILKSEDNTYYGTQFGVSGDIPAPGDYDGDGKADTAVFRPSSGTWFIQGSTAGFTATTFGSSEDVPTVGDFDGDGKSDVAVFRPSSGTWFRLNSSNGAFVGDQFGQTGDKVVPADYTGDGKTDLAVWRPSNGTWYIMRSEDNSFYGAQFGVTGDLPAPGDYDGDGKADVTVFRPSSGTWFEQRSTSGFTAVQFGTNGDKPAPGAFVY